MGRIFPRPGRNCVWSIGMYAGKSPLDVVAHPDFVSPVLTSKEITDVKADFVADPFLFKEGADWYLFFEVLNSKTCLGEIAWAKSKDFGSWEYGGVVLRQSTHMSYPYVFDHAGVKHMIPEIYAAGEVVLYRAQRFPDEWQRQCVLIEEPLYDSSVVFHEGMWYLFGSTATFDLRLFCSQSLYDGWVEHPASPLVKRDKLRARPAGRIINWQGQLYRFCQDCRKGYGVAVYAVKINRLNPVEYSEELSRQQPVIAASGKGWNAVGMHTVCAEQVSADSWVAAVDGYYKRWGIKRY